MRHKGSGRDISDHLKTNKDRNDDARHSRTVTISSHTLSLAHVFGKNLLSCLSYFKLKQAARGLRLHTVYFDNT